MTGLHSGEEDNREIEEGPDNETETSSTSPVALQPAWRSGKVVSASALLSKRLTSSSPDNTCLCQPGSALEEAVKEPVLPCSASAQQATSPDRLKAHAYRFQANVMAQGLCIDDHDRDGAFESYGNSGEATRQTTSHKGTGATAESATDGEDA